MLEQGEGAITFTRLDISPRRVRVDAIYANSVEIWFEFDRAMPVSSSQVALVLATLCVGKYKQISFDFEVEAPIIDRIRDYVPACVEARPVPASPMPRKHNFSVLSFSGGFDSLSALRVMPDDTELVSLDFGGWFTREAEFFQKFKPLTIRTNMRSVPTQATSLARNHWSFMAAGAILSAQYFNSKYHTFGSILGESLAQLSGGAKTLPVLSVFGMQEAGYTRGLTEVGTTSVILQSDRDLVADSLTSLAGAKDRKRFRKAALCRTVSKTLDLELKLPRVDVKDSPRIMFGDDYASSLAALYCMSRGQSEYIQGLFEAVPDSAVRLASELRMNFMEKVNWDQYRGFPDRLREDLWEKFSRYDLHPYSQEDWDEVRAVRDYMRTQYEIAHGVSSGTTA